MLIQHHYTLGRWKVLPKRDTTTCIVGCLKYKNLTVHSNGNDMDKLELSYNADVNIKWFNYFGKVL